jgi:hypothetical protein
LSTEKERVEQTLRVAEKAASALVRTRSRLASSEPDNTWLPQAAADEAFAEKIETFASRFGRLQEMIGDKLLPRIFALLQEPPRPAIDMFARAERLGWVDSAEQWFVLRALRSRLVHEYIDDPAEFARAISAALKGVDTLLGVLENLRRVATAHPK